MGKKSCLAMTDNKTLQSCAQTLRKLRSRGVRSGVVRALASAVWVRGAAILVPEVTIDNQSVLLNVAIAISFGHPSAAGRLRR